MPDATRTPGTLKATLLSRSSRKVSPGGKDEVDQNVV